VNARAAAADDAKSDVAREEKRAAQEAARIPRPLALQLQLRGLCGQTGQRNERPSRIGSARDRLGTPRTWATDREAEQDRRIQPFVVMVLQVEDGFGGGIVAEHLDRARTADRRGGACRRHEHGDRGGKAEHRPPGHVRSLIRAPERWYS
jgi:hypothetical protein